MAYISKKSGFTLAEIIIVVSVIMTLSIMGLTTFNRQTQRARDDKRVADLEQIRSALEMFRLNQPGRTYPIYTGSGGLGVSLNGPIRDYVSVIPTDPGRNNALRQYYYWSDGNQYRLCARLETAGGTTDCANNCGGACNYQVTSP